MIYIASPFFNRFEVMVRDMMIEAVHGIGESAFSPACTDSSMAYSKTIDLKERKGLAENIFQENLIHLRHCSKLIFPKFTTDLGTLFEIGYFMALGKPIMRYNYLSQKIEEVEYKPEPFSSCPIEYITLFRTKDAVLFGYLAGLGYSPKYYIPDGKMDNIMFSVNFTRVDIEGHPIERNWMEVE